MDQPAADTELAARPQLAAYVGLSERAKLLVLLIAALIAVANLAAAWHFAQKTEQALTLSSADMEPFKAWLTTVADGKLSSDVRYDLGARAMTLVASLKLVSNKQALVLTSFGGAFALLAIGFALFVIGADGAFKVLASSSATARVAVTGTAPGLLCFIISGALMWSGIQHRSELTAPALRSNAATVLDSQSAQPVPSGCESTDLLTGKCK